MRTLVVKIGTSTLISEGQVDESFIAGLADQVARLHAEEWRVVIVTSGAVRVGLNTIGRARAVHLAEKQAAAAVGQSLVMRAYRRAFERHGLHVAQLLLTRTDTADRRRFLNARHTVAQLLRWGVVPIVNENDTVSTEEIRVGDNDTLAALTALVAEADLILLLSDVSGFYLPGCDQPEPVISAITAAIESAAGGAGSAGGTGGMLTKIEAARIATQAGIELVIAYGKANDVVLDVAHGRTVGTRFTAQAVLRGRKRWIAYGRAPQGTLLLDERARCALVSKGSSLLPIGVKAVEGDFAAGALVALRDSEGEYGRGLTNCSAAELRRIAGCHSSQIAAVLGREDITEVIHRDNLTLLAPRAG
jgi:glutamate 5-kinase